MKGYKGDKTIKMTEKWERQNLLLNKYKNRNKFQEWKNKIITRWHHIKGIKNRQKDYEQ